MKAEGDWSDYVRDDGTLGGPRVLVRETIYVSPAGNKVERFHDGEHSRIFKPVSFTQTVGRERWAHENVLSRLAGFCVPSIVASSDVSGCGPHWLIYDDMGELNHCKSPDERIKAAGWIAEWHGLPASLVPAEFAGHTPYFEEVWKQVTVSDLQIHERLVGCSSAAVERWTALLAEAPGIVGSDRVVSHGDYHPYNVAIQEGERIVLDWEFVHLNHRYWDIYSLLDITSPRYARTSLAHEQRIAALRHYWDRSEKQLQTGGSFQSFCEGYWYYASVFSAWIAGLIDEDLKRGVIPSDLLLRQKRETSAVFEDCLFQLGIQS